MEKIKWNDNWKVWRETNAFILVPFIPNSGKDVTLPYDAVFHTPQDPESVNEGKTGFMDGGTFQYLKEFDVPLEDKGKDIRLLIERSAVKTWVTVNDSFAGECDYPYQEFTVDIAPYLRYGETNTVKVTANSLDLSTRFYVGGGLYKDVWLLKGGDAFIEPDTLHITTLSLHDGSADALIELDITNAAAFGQDQALHFSVADKDGRKRLDVCFPVRLAAKGKTRFSRRFFIRDIRTWDEFDPVLYTCTASLEDKSGAVIDTESSVCGFRTVTVDAENGLRVNGRETKLLGACVHHDQGILGAETYDAYEYRRVKRLKEEGFNAIRSCHYPAGRSLLRACDELGVYILDETFDMWNRMKNPNDFSMFFEKNYRSVVETMVKVDYNHPSVIMYSIGNEIIDAATERGFELGGKLTALFHKLDPTRSTTAAVNPLLTAGSRLLRIASEKTGRSASDIMHGDVNEAIAELGHKLDDLMDHPLVDEMLEQLDGVVDVSGYNYQVDRYQRDVDRWPDRVILGTETHAKRIGDHWRLMRENHSVIGDFIWTGWSYLGEVGGHDNFPRLQNESCDLDIVGEKRPTSYYRDVVLGRRTEPYIVSRTPVQSREPMKVGPWSLTDAIPCWDYPGFEGQEVDVEVYFPGDEAELFINGVSKGRKGAGELCCRASFRVPYEPGDVTAVAYRGGAEISRFTLRTLGAPASLRAVQEENQPDAELVFIRVEALSRDGVPGYFAVPDLTVHVPEGCGLELLGFGSYEAKHASGFQSPVLAITSGTALAILRKKGHGEAEIRFTADGMTGASVKAVF